MTLSRQKPSRLLNASSSFIVNSTTWKRIFPQPRVTTEKSIDWLIMWTERLDAYHKTCRETQQLKTPREKRPRRQCNNRMEVSGHFCYQTGRRRSIRGHWKPWQPKSPHNPQPQLADKTISRTSTIHLIYTLLFAGSVSWRRENACRSLQPGKHARQCRMYARASRGRSIISICALLLILLADTMV